MIEIAERILNEGGVIALIAIVVTVALYFVTRALNVVVGLFVTRLEEVAKANANASASMVKVMELVNANAARMAGLGAAIDDAVAEMRGAVSLRTEEINQLPGRVREEMSKDFEQLPQVIVDTLLPTLEALKTAIAAEIGALERSFNERIEAATGKIPSATTQMLSEELIRLRATFESRIGDVITQLSLIVENVNKDKEQ